MSLSWRLVMRMKVHRVCPNGSRTRQGWSSRSPAAPASPSKAACTNTRHRRGCQDAVTRNCLPRRRPAVSCSLNLQRYQAQYMSCHDGVTERQRAGVEETY
jgi:hypothetical protein